MLPLYTLTLDFKGDHVDALGAHARRWLGSKYRRWGGFSGEDDSADLGRGHSARLRTTHVENGRLVEFSLEHPDSRHPGLHWHTAFSAATDGTASECSVVLSTRSTGYVDAPPRADQIHTPRLVRDIVHDLEPTVGVEPVALVPYAVGPDEVDLLADVLQQDRRALPIVVVSEVAGSGPLVDPAVLQQRLFGHARVFHVSASASRVLSARIGRDLSCFDGGVRIYWPGFSTSDDRTAHRLYLKWDIREMDERGPALSDALFERLLSASVARFDGGRLAARIRQTRDAASNARREADRSDLAATADDGYRATAEVLLAEADATIWDLQHSRTERERYIRDLTAANEALRRELDQALANVQAAYAYSETAGAEDDGEAPPVVWLSEVARTVYDAERARRRKFDVLLGKLADEDHRTAISRPNAGGGSHVGGQGHTDERAFWTSVDGRIHVCELFPYHDDDLEDRYHALRSGALEHDAYGGFEAWTSPARLGETA